MSKKQLRFYEKSLEINKENLDEELSGFPGIFYTVTDHYLSAMKHRKRLQARLDVEFAALASAIRSAHLQEGKITETQIKQEIPLHPKYRKLNARLADAVYIQDRWSALKEAYIQKSFALKGLVSLAVHEQYQSDSSSDKKSGRK